MKNIPKNFLKVMNNFKICKIYDLQECLVTRIDEHGIQVFNANDNTSMRMRGVGDILKDD